jgi:predicted DNA-binding transcriptional regulator YafY
LHKNPKGLTSNDLAKLCNVCIRTIQRDLIDLQSDLNVPITQDGDRYGILNSYTLPPIFFSLYEAMSLFLTARLTLRETDENNPHMKQALIKMSTVLPSPVSEWLKTGIETMSLKKTNPDYLKIFESIAEAWITQRQLKIQYSSLEDEQVKEWVLDPYFVEMTGVGYSLYVIGHAVRKGKEGIITFKLNRIRSAEVLETSFDIQPGLDIGKLLTSSWGIMWGEETEIKLRFSAGVTRRVKESVWHPSQMITNLPEGGCIMTFHVGSLLEVTPWIRSWGPDVEVLEPKGLREQFKMFAEQQYRVYCE